MSHTRLVGALFLLIAALVFAPLAYGASGPSNTSPPEISGEAVVGQTLTADPGEWSGDPEPTIAYQWQRCEQTPPSASFSGVTWPVSGFSGGIALDSSGDIFLASLDESFEGAVDKYGPTGSPITTYTDPSISGVWDVATDLAGNVYATNQFSETITKTTSAGVTSVFKSVPGNFGLAGIDVDSAGNVYVTSTLDEAYKVFKFGSDGTEVTSDGFPISFGAQELPQDVAVDSAGRIYVIVSNFTDEGLIARFLPNGTPDGEWGRPTSLGGGRFEGVFSIALDGADNLFVAESDRVVAFDPSMNYLTSWTGGAGGGGRDCLQRPSRHCRWSRWCRLYQPAARRFWWQRDHAEVHLLCGPDLPADLRCELLDSSGNSGRWGQAAQGYGHCLQLRGLGRSHERPYLGSKGLHSRGRRHRYPNRFDRSDRNL